MLSQALTGLRQRVRARHGPMAPSSLLADIQLERRSLYILPTREGLYYAAMLAVMLLAAINYANGLAYALTFMLAAVAVVAILHTHRNLSGLRLAAGSAPPVFVGDVATFTVIAHNDSDLARHALEISIAGRGHRIHVPARGATTIAFAVSATHRGFLAAPALKVRTRFPVGLWHAWSRALLLPARCLIYPRPAPEYPLPQTPGPLTGREPARSAEGEDFTGLREFRAGDPVQRIAWKKVAAGQGWHTKQFSTPAGQIVWLEWDALAGLGVEERLSILCRWVLTAEQQGVAYGLRLPGTAFAPSSGPTHRDRCLERLALFEAPS